MRRFAILAALSILLAAPSALAACPDAETIQRYVEDWQAKRPTKALPITNLDGRGLRPRQAHAGSWGLPRAGWSATRPD